MERYFLNGRLLKRPVIYMDMDGVLAKWNSSASEEEVAARNYFLNRDMELSVIMATKILADKGYNVKVLSAAYTVRACWEKRTWLDNAGLDGIEAVFVPYGEPKSEYVDSLNGILVDDFGKNLKEWNGIPVKFYNGINGRGGTKYTYKLFSEWDAGVIARKLEDILLSNS